MKSLPLCQWHGHWSHQKWQIKDVPFSDKSCAIAIIKDIFVKRRLCPWHDTKNVFKEVFASIVCFSDYGKIEFHEFVCMMAKQKCGHKDPEDESVQAFKVGSFNNDSQQQSCLVF